MIQMNKVCGKRPLAMSVIDWIYFKSLIQIKWLVMTNKPLPKQVITTKTKANGCFTIKNW